MLMLDYHSVLYRMLEPSHHVKAMSNVGVGPPFPLFEKKNVLFFNFIEEINLIHGDFLTYRDINYGPQLKSLF